MRRLESQPQSWWSWLFQKSRSRKYCYACLKSHPLNEFDPSSDWYQHPTTRRRCLGIIVLCPCLKFSLERLIRIRTVDNLNYMCPALDTTKCIPRWHQCTYKSSSGSLSYTLVISVSLTWTEEVIFDFEYSIHINHYMYCGARRIMLCPHMDALEAIRNYSFEFPPPSFMSCKECDIVPLVNFSDDLTEYEIRFSRAFRLPGISKSYPGTSVLDEDIADYNWTRYEPLLRKTSN